MERSWPQGHHPTQKHRIIVICKTCSEEPGETKAGKRVIGVSMERSWPQGHHKMSGPHPTLQPQPIHAKSIFYANMFRRIWRTKARYEGDWGVYGKVLTSGSPHNVRIPSQHPHPTPPQKCKITVICKTCPEEPGETKAGTRVIVVSMERSWPQGHHKMDGPLHKFYHLFS